MYASNQFELDCVVVGHFESGFASHERTLRSKGTERGDYRNVRMDYITVGEERMSYMDVLNHQTGRHLHWSEMPQVAPVYLCSYLLHRGFKSEFASFFQPRRGELNEFLHRTRTVAVTTTLYLNPMTAAEVVAYIRAINPGIHIIVGGPLIDNLHFHLADGAFRYTLGYIGADTYVLERTGEKTLASVLQSLKSNGNPAKVRNCFVRKGKDFVFTGKELEVNALDEDPIEWDLFAHKDLGPTVQTRTALGCPFRCTFCDYPVRAGEYVTQSIDVVERELRQIQERDSVENMVFIDDTFNVPLNRFKDILRMMVRNRFTFHWYSYLRCNVVDQELAELMQESRCAGVFLGIESGDAGVLRNMKKMATPEQYQRRIKHLNDAGIVSFASLIVGFPGETQQSIENTIGLITEAKPTFFRGEIWYYNHRSPVFNDREKLGIDGNGYQWRHNTMDWDQACEMVLKLFKEAAGSTWLPMYDMDFWVLPYLRGKGFTFDQIKTFVAICDKLLADELGIRREPFQNREALERELRDYCQKLPA